MDRKTYMKNIYSKYWIYAREREYGFLEYDKNLSSMKLHRYLSLIHFTGMSIQPWLGYQASNNPDDYDHYMDMHRKTGEVVLASYAFATFADHSYQSQIIISF